MTTNDAKTQPLCTSAESILRVLGEVEKLYCLARQRATCRLMLSNLKSNPVPGWGVFGEEFYSSGWGGRRLLIRIRVCVGSGGSDGKESTCNTGDLGWEDPLQKGTATHSSILAWRIPWTEEPGRLHSMGSQRVRQD